jgi:DNA-binding transcriptional MerR regulator
MAIQLLPPRSTPQSRIAESISTGLADTLRGLGEQKANQLAKAQKIHSLQAFGLNPEESRAILSLPEKTQGQLLMSYLEKGGGAPEKQDFGGVGGFISPQQQMSPEGQNLLAQAQEVQSQPESERSQQLRAQRTNKPSIAEVLSRPSKAETAKEQVRIDKETLPAYTETLKNQRAAKDNDKRLSRMEELLHKGDLGAPIRNSIIKTISEGVFGQHGPKLDLKFLMSADAQEFEKLSADFARSASDFFPGRLTDTDLRTFMAAIPTLSLTKAGNLRLINSMKSANKAAELKYSALKQIIQENGGRRPANLDILIEERIGPQLDNLSKEFIKAPLLPENFGGGVVRY